jgi:DNA-binding beta-propeller fold protein YncE
VAVINDNNRQSAWKIEFTAYKRIALTMIRWRYPTLVKSLLSVMAVCFILAGDPTAASDFMVPVKSIAQITIDDDNRVIDYPAAVFFDPVVEEIYLVNGGRNRLVVYGPDFFPRMSIGIGRGIITPRGGIVLSNGDVYIGQVKTAKNPRPRITILNGAFFVEREIFLDEIPEAENFIPRNLAINKDGIIYLAGDSYRGVLVLDNEGNFLRKLQPMDQVILRGEDAIQALEEEKKQKEEPEGEDATEALDEEEKQKEELDLIVTYAEDSTPEEDIYADIPEEFRPRTSQPDDVSGGLEVLGPVKINFVAMDKAGKLYLISAETGKIYVYGPDESFLFSFGTKGGSPGQQSRPRSMTIDEELGVIYVADYMRHTILAYNMMGEYVFEFGGRGFQPTWFNFPNDITINNQGQVIVADLFNKRVQVLEIGREGISYYMDKSSLEGEEETPDTVEPSESDEFSPPEQTEDVLDQGNESDTSLEQLYQTIKEEKSAFEEENIIEEVIEEENIQKPEIPEQPEATEELPDHDAVNGFLRSWLEVWQQQDIEAYLTHYSRDFSPEEGLSIVDWEIARHKALSKPKFIRVEIRDIQIQKLSDSSSKASFIQSYQSDTHSDEVIKTLELIWENGGWLIIKEDSKALQ